MSARERTDERDTAASRRADDLFWHGAVEELGLAPDLDRLEREATEEEHPRLGLAERLETRLSALPPLPRTAAITAGAVLATVALAALLALLKAVLLAIGTGLPALLGERPLEFHASLAHVVALALILIVLLSGREPGTPTGLVAQRAWSQFRRGWLLLWLAWLALYLWMSAYWGRKASDAAGFWNDWGAPVADLLNVASSAVFFYLFLVLDRPSVKADGLPERDRAFRRSLLGVGTVCGAAALLSILGRLERFDLAQFGPTIGSILVAISMAFFVGRLSDSHLKVRRSLLAPLYFYVALQMLWHLFVMAGGENAVASALVLFGALALKVYLFALLTRWIQDGKLQRYFDEVAFPRLASDLVGLDEE